MKTTGLDQESHVKVDMFPRLEILSLTFLINITSPIILSVYKMQHDNRTQNTTSFKSSITDRQQVLTRLEEVAHLAYSLKNRTETLVRGLFCIAHQNHHIQILSFKYFSICLLVKAFDVLIKVKGCNTAEAV